MGEEYGSDGDGASVRWFVDPIDGTHNFMRGVPIFATLLGVERDGELQAGIVSAPAMGGRWFAWRGGGAWGAGPLAGADRGGAPSRLHVTGIADLADAQVVYAGTQDVIDVRRMPRASRGCCGAPGGSADSATSGATRSSRREPPRSWWRSASRSGTRPHRVVLIEEAGGRITDFHGRRIFDGGTTLATNGVLHETVRSILTAG